MSRLRRIRAEPSAALIGYDDTTLFHHASYATSYMAVQLRYRRHRKLPLAPFRQDRAKHAGRKIPTDKPGKSGDETSFACNTIMYEQYIVLYYIVGPICRGPNGHVRTSLEI